jgi:glycine cleavage system aminomethyltransferase T
VRARIAGIPVEISRTGYTGDLGYEIWAEAARRCRCGTR